MSTSQEPSPADEEFAGLRGLMEKATPGPWRRSGYTNYNGFMISSESDPAFGCITERWEKFNSGATPTGREDQRDANSALIVAAVNALPRLLAAASENARLRARIEAAYREGWSAGNSEGISDGHPLGGLRPFRGSVEKDWEVSDARRHLAEIAKEGEK